MWVCASSRGHARMGELTGVAWLWIDGMLNIDAIHAFFFFFFFFFFGCDCGRLVMSWHCRITSPLVAATTTAPVTTPRPARLQFSGPRPFWLLTR